MSAHAGEGGGGAGIVPCVEVVIMYAHAGDGVGGESIISYVEVVCMSMLAREEVEKE